MSVDLRHFRSFVVIAEEGNIGRAAARLFISQPALTRQLQQLEKQLELALFTRVPQGVELTDAGRELLEKARAALDAAEEALTIGRPARPRGRLVLGLTVAGHAEHWYELATAFTEQHPLVDVEIHSALSELLQRQVLAGELDVAVVLEPSRRTGVRYEVLREEQVFAWTHPDHPLASDEEVTVSEVAEYPVILVGGTAGRGSGFNAAVRRIFAEAGCDPEYVQPPDLIPSNAVRGPNDVALSVDVGFASDVRRLRLAGDHRMRYEIVHREDAGTAAIRAFVAFAARHARTT